MKSIFWITGSFVFCLALAQAGLALADDDDKSSPALMYPHFKVSPRTDKNDSLNQETPPSDRPDNNVTAMPRKAKEQFDRNEEKNRKDLEEHKGSDRPRDDDRDHDNQNDHSDHHKPDHPETKLRKFTPGGFVTQVFPNTKDGSVYRKDIPGERRSGNTGRHYQYDSRRQVYFYEDRVDYVPVIVPPAGYETLTAGGIVYFYNDGQFYVPTNGLLLEVQPPVGAVVQELPKNYVFIEDDRETYGIIDGVYYRKVSEGFEVTNPPFTGEDKSSSRQKKGELIIHLPDARGHFVQIILERSSGGFTGPQDEFYPAFPPIEQLQEMYANKD